MKGYDPEKYLCYSFCPQHNVKFHKTTMSYIMRISILTLIWGIFSMAFRPPKFDTSLKAGAGALNIILFILNIVVLVYTFMTFFKYGKNKNPDESYVKTYIKVTLVLLGLTFVLLVCMFIIVFLMIISFIENYEYNLDTAWIAVMMSVMIICLLLTTWEIYLLVMLLLEGEKQRIHTPKKTKVIKSTPVYTNTTANNNIEYNNPTNNQSEGFEDDFMGMNVQGGKYIGDSTSQASDQKDPQLGPKKVEGTQDDFFGPKLDNDKKGDDAQYYQTDNPNKDLNKKGKDEDQPL